jgi:hypothetical protein
MGMMVMRFTGLGLVVALWSASSVSAGEPVRPNPGYEPVQVITLQLEGLATNDVPYADAGIARAWAFAHPDNRRLTGPLERFTAMIKSDSYRTLIDHRRHTIKPVSRTDDEAVFAVTVAGADNKVVGYRWVVRKVQSGAYAGAWMTTAVSAPVAMGDAI